MWLAYFLIFYLLLVSFFFHTSYKTILVGTYGNVISRSRKDKTLLILSFIVLAGLACFRGPNVGTDTLNYIELYETAGYDASGFFIMRYEPGFSMYIKFLYYFSKSPQILLITSSGFIMYSFGKFINRYSCCVWLSVFVFFCLFFNSSLNTIRQYIAISILFYAFDAVIKRNKLRFLFFILVAFMFHYTSIVFLIAYPLYNFKIKRNTLSRFSILLPIVIIVSLAISITVFSVLRSYGLFNYYSEDNIYIEGGIKLATILLLLFYSVLMIFPVKAWRVTGKVQIINDDQVNKLSFMFGLITLLLLAASLPFNLIDRFTSFFSVYLCILLPNSIYELNKRKIRVRYYSIILVLLMSTFYIVINSLRPDWTNVYPYNFY